MSKTEWFDKFFDDLYGRVLNGQFDPASSLRQSRLVEKVLRLRKGQSVLDCPCGQGRLTIPLARMGLRMTGADFQPSYLARARRRARKESLAVDFVCCDMRELPFSNQFDAVINWFGSFGYFDDAGNRATARAAFTALKPGGRFLIDGMNKSWVLSHWRGRDERIINGVRVAHVARWDPRTSRTRVMWTFRHGRRQHRRPIFMRLYNGSELRALLRSAGFRDVQFFGHESLARVGDVSERFTRHSRRFLAVATKPPAPRHLGSGAQA